MPLGCFLACNKSEAGHWDSLSLEKAIDTTNFPTSASTDLCNKAITGLTFLDRFPFPGGGLPGISNWPLVQTQSLRLSASLHKCLEDCRCVCSRGSGFGGRRAQCTRLGARTGVRVDLASWPQHTYGDSPYVCATPEQMSYKETPWSTGFTRKAGHWVAPSTAEACGGHRAAPPAHEHPDARFPTQHNIHYSHLVIQPQINRIVILYDTSQEKPFAMPLCISLRAYKC